MLVAVYYVCSVPPKSKACTCSCSCHDTGMTTIMPFRSRDLFAWPVSCIHHPRNHCMCHVRRHMTFISHAAFYQSERTGFSNMVSHLSASSAELPVRGELLGGSRLLAAVARRTWGICRRQGQRGNCGRGANSRVVIKTCHIVLSLSTYQLPAG